MTWANKKFSLYKKNIQRFADVIIMFFCHVANNKVHNVAFDVVNEKKLGISSSFLSRILNRTEIEF